MAINYLYYRIDSVGYDNKHYYYNTGSSYDGVPVYEDRDFTMSYASRLVLIKNSTAEKKYVKVDFSNQPEDVMESPYAFVGTFVEEAEILAWVRKELYDAMEHQLHLHDELDDVDNDIVDVIGDVASMAVVASSGQDVITLNDSVYRKLSEITRKRERNNAIRSVLHALVQSKGFTSFNAYPGSKHVANKYGVPSSEFLDYPIVEHRVMPILAYIERTAKSNVPSNLDNEMYDRRYHQEFKKELDLWVNGVMTMDSFVIDLDVWGSRNSPLGNVWDHIVLDRQRTKYLASKEDES